MERMRRDDDRDAIEVELDTDEPDPGLSVVDTVAELEDVEPTELSPIYDCIDHMLDGVFSNPPDPEANVRVAFDYEGYRITVEQDGSAWFVPRSD